MTFAELKEMLEKMSPEELNKDIEIYDGLSNSYIRPDFMRDEDFPENFIFMI